MGGVEAPHHHLLESDEGAGLRAAPPVGVEERDGVQFHGAIAVSIRGGHGEAVQVEGAVREHDAFGRPGGAAGVEELADGRLVEGADIGAVDAAGGEQGFVLGSDGDETLDGGAGGAQVIGEGGEVGFVDEDAGLGVIQDTGELGWGKAHVQRHDDAAGEGDAVVSLEELVVVEAEIGDTIAGLDARGEQSRSEAFAAFAEFGVGVAVLAGNDGSLPGVEVDTAVEAADRRQGNVHDFWIVQRGCKKGTDAKKGTDPFFAKTAKKRLSPFLRKNVCPLFLLFAFDAHAVEAAVYEDQGDQEENGRQDRGESCSLRGSHARPPARRPAGRTGW